MTSLFKRIGLPFTHEPDVTTFTNPCFARIQNTHNITSRQRLVTAERTANG